MTVLSQSSKETSCCSPLLMETRNEYLTGNETNEDFALERGLWENPILMEATHLFDLLCYSLGASPSEEGM